VSSAPATRTCAGCGRKAPKAELVRFVARGGSLAHDSLGEGRGAYTCRSLACFERAQASRAFNRILKTSVRVDPALARIYTDANG
jgi:predicted RNA-binding protein YlxR (DUF448 family)